MLAAPTLLVAQPKIQLVPFTAGFTRPTDIAHCGDSRLFIVEQSGVIWALDSLGNRLDTFLNITARVRSVGNEQGLLGLAFPPDYAQTGHFYVDYTRVTDGYTRVSRFTVSAGSPNRADPNSEEILFTQAQPYNNHNGGCLKFGPDHYLYIALGDGGSGGDPQGNGQKKSTLLGKIARIDVNSTSPGLPYGIPADNPFVSDTTARPEIWDLGLRNPWRYSFDRLTGDLWIADVGQGSHEEIDFEPAHTGGLNYGWRCYEGFSPYNTSGCPPATAFTAPIFDYPHTSGNCSVTGGFVYRGSQYADLYGLYLFADYCTGWWWATRSLPDGTFATAQIADLANNQYSTFGEDRDGELYVAALSQGTIYRVTELCSSFQISGTVTDATCNGAFNGMIDLDVQGGKAPYSFTWSNDQTDSLVVYLNPGTYTVEAQDGNGCIRRDTFEVGTTEPIQTPEIAALSWSAPLPGPGLICTADSVLLESTEAPAGFGYQWLLDGQNISGATNQQYTAHQVGTYQVVFSSPACNSPFSQVLIIPEVVVPIPTISSSGVSVLCPGDTIELTATGPPPGFTLQWYLDTVLLPGANSPALTVTTGGAYTVAFERPGCADLWIADPALIEQEMAISFELLFQNDTLSLSAGNWTAYQWYRDGSLLPGATGPRYAPAESGFYEVEVSSPLGCAYRRGLQVTVLGTVLPPGIVRFDLSPNPTAGVVQLDLELVRTEQVNLQLRDVQERIVLSRHWEGQRLEQKFDLTGLTAGTYILTIQLERGNLVRRIVKH